MLILRKINYTGRRRIAKGSVSVDLTHTTSGHYRFSCALDISELRVQKSAHVYVEAYYRTAYMRFDFGTVESIIPPADTLLTQIPKGARPLFRVKVVHRARILAAADKVFPVLPEEEEQDRLSILPVEFSDLGAVLWCLDSDGDKPILHVNKDVPEIREIVRADPAFHALVFPEAVRQILKRILEDEYTDSQCDPDDWQAQWLMYIQSLPGMDAPPTGNSEDSDELKLENAEWVEKAVGRFAAKLRAREKFTRVHQQQEGE